MNTNNDRNRRPSSEYRRAAGEREYRRTSEERGYRREAEEREPKKERILFSTGGLVAVLAAFMIVAIIMSVKSANKETPEEPDYSKVENSEHQPVTPTPTPMGWDYVDNCDRSVVENLGNWVLVLDKQAGMSLQVVEDDYIHKKVTISVSGIGKDTLTDEDFRAVIDNTYYEGLAEAKKHGNPPSAEFVYEIAGGTGSISINEGTIYEWKITEDGGHYYMEAYKPRDLYDFIVVIDAGHGGADPGCMYFDHKEKVVTLAYSDAIRALGDQQSEIKFYYTRQTDANLVEDYGTALQMRPDFANEIGADLFLSIHMNANDSAKMNGTSCYFNEKMDSYSYSSRTFAQAIQNSVLSTLGLKNMGLEAAAEKLSITKYATMPVVLLEVGFLSNEKDCNVITNQANIEKAAAGIFQTIRQAGVDMGKLK